MTVNQQSGGERLMGVLNGLSMGASLESALKGGCCAECVFGLLPMFDLVSAIRRSGHIANWLCFRQVGDAETGSRKLFCGERKMRTLQMAAQPA